MIQGDPENIDAQLRTEYSVKALTDAGVEVEQLDLQRGDWDRNKGQEICQNDLAKFGDQIEVVFCNNDDMAIGALQAIQLPAVPSTRTSTSLVLTLWTLPRTKLPTAT